MERQETGDGGGGVNFGGERLHLVFVVSVTPHLGGTTARNRGHFPTPDCGAIQEALNCLSRQGPFSDPAIRGQFLTLFLVFCGPGFRGHRVGKK